MGGTLLNKRYIKRKKNEEYREDGDVVDVKTAVSSIITSTGPTGGTVDVEQTTISSNTCSTNTNSPDSDASTGAPRKRRKQASPKADTNTATHKNAKHRVSFNAHAPSVVSIDGLGSQIIQRFRDSIWYTVSVDVGTTPA